MNTKIVDIKIGERYRKLQESQVNFLMKSISAHGLISPIIIDLDNNLVAGMHRLEACKRLGYEIIPTIHADTTDPEQLKHIEMQENIARTSKHSTVEKCKIIYETNKMLEELGMKQKAGRPDPNKKLYTLEDIGAQIGVKRDTAKEYLAVWTNLSEDARKKAEEYGVTNIKALQEIAKLPAEKQLDALMNIDEIKKKLSTTEKTKVEKEKTIKTISAKDQLIQDLQNKIKHLEAEIKALNNENDLLKKEVTRLKKSNKKL